MCFTDIRCCLFEFKFYFNPRSPHGERQDPPSHRTLSIMNFNPRSPHGERPPVRSPRPTATPNFNPRSPHGERPAHLERPGHGHNFNPRSPHGERRFPKPIRFPVSEFQSTLSSRRATRIHHGMLPGGDISIHALLTESDNFVGYLPVLIGISIHALLTESDSRYCL